MLQCWCSAWNMRMSTLMHRQFYLWCGRVIAKRVFSIELEEFKSMLDMTIDQFMQIHVHKHARETLGQCCTLCYPSKVKPLTIMKQPLKNKKSRERIFLEICVWHHLKSRQPLLFCVTNSLIILNHVSSEVTWL